MDELDLIRFRYGGVNITGFRLIDPEQPSIQSIRRDWQQLNPALWRGAGPGNSLQVLRQLHSHLFHFLSTLILQIGKAIWRLRDAC
jgi:hypothetical protein